MSDNQESDKIYLGSMTPSNGGYGGYKINICLSDIPKDKIVVGSNGKKYFTLFANELKEPAEDRTHYLVVNKAKYVPKVPVADEEDIPF